MNRTIPAYSLMRKLTTLVVGALLLLPVGCDDTDTPSSDADEMPLVVEGWIAEDETPVVMVTHAIPLDADITDFSTVVERWCRVSIFDNEQQYMLTARMNDSYIPSLIYTSARLRGKEGHTYRLLVETDTRSASAEVTMPMREKMTMQLKAEPVEGIDTLYRVRAFVDNLQPDGCYKFYVRGMNTDSRLYPAFMGNLTAADYDPEQGREISRGIHALFNSDEEDSFTHYFHPGETVMVQLCRIAPEVFNFWQVYDANVSLSNNLFFTFTSDCPGNITGAKGYFSPHCATTSSIRIPPTVPR